ncbi:hypothetical protein OROGR_013371 [Orobanche gracilis]
MAYYENLMTEQPWHFRPAFADAWFSEDFANETETLTNALQSSFSGNSSNGDVFSAEVVESRSAEPVWTPAVSVGSENEFSVSKQRRGCVPPSGRVSKKRKSRGSNRSATARTTFIAVDPANFRQMVQQVTGERFGGLDASLAVATVSEPDGIKIKKGARWDEGLSTLDTSAILLDGSASPQVSRPTEVADGGGSAAGERLLDSFCSFPTLESWKALE